MMNLFYSFCLLPHHSLFSTKGRAQGVFSAVLCFKCRVVHLFAVVLLSGSRDNAENAGAKQIVTLVLTPVVSGAWDTPRSCR